MTSSELENEWMKYLVSMKNTTNFSLNSVSEQLNKNIIDAAPEIEEKEKKPSYIPPPPPIEKNLYISTKTKVLFLNRPIDIHEIYWNIPILDYWKQTEGVVKKTIKFVSLTREKRDELVDRLKTIPCYKEDIIRQIEENVTMQKKTIQFKDERKISIGISKKDIMACRSKKKNVFYNCFSLVLRIWHNSEFREIHVKIFNTGKMEIPGILNKNILDISKDMILNILRDAIKSPDIDYIVMTDEKKYNVLINSNFSCGFFINREKLHQILRSKKYNLDTSYDPCTYPGVKCKFYYNNELDESRPELQNGCIEECDHHLKMKTIEINKKYTEVSIMIFRTGSGLIVGNCCENTLNVIYDFILKILYDEYYNIYISNSSPVVKQKNTKIRKRTLVFTGGEVLSDKK